MSYNTNYPIPVPDALGLENVEEELTSTPPEAEDVEAEVAEEAAAIDAINDPANAEIIERLRPDES